MINMGDVPLVDAIKMITATPARIMKLSDKIGSLKKGMDADILVFNQEIEMQSIIIKGNQVK
jgi:N-acetylglucosamine-6-phosphate deacetylase